MVAHAAMTLVQAPMTGTIWSVVCRVGQPVSEGEALVVIESMKMELPVEAERAGVVAEIRCREGQAVTAGETLVVLAPE